MSDIDPEKLATAIVRWKSPPSCNFDEMIAASGVVLAAAEQYLATLPRFKEIEVGVWALLTSTGDDVQGWTNSDEQANEWRRTEKGAVVRLTGTAKVRVND